jgi:predicted nucleotidyltransferase
MKTPQIDLSEQAIGEFCERWKVNQMSLFGSALGDGFGPESDVDVLVSFAPDADWSLLDHVRMEEELSGLLGRAVDIVSKRAVEGSTNWMRKESILGSARVVYGSR